MGLIKKKMIVMVIILVIGLSGVINLAVGVLSFLEINSLNIPEKVTTLSSSIDSLDLASIPPSLSTLRNQIQDLKTEIVGELEIISGYSRYLDVASAYFILQGLTFIALSIAIYLMIPKKDVGSN